MTKKNRDRLLRLAKLLESTAKRIRHYVALRTPKRGPNKRTLAVGAQVGIEDIAGSPRQPEIQA